MKVWLVKDKQHEIKCSLPGTGISNYFVTAIPCGCNSHRVMCADEDPEVVERYLMQYNGVCTNCGVIRGKLYMRVFTH